jgi:L-ascorbate metabolism protein UlaG (beta-lactamase superfamily)
MSLQGRRLCWAGIEVHNARERILVDPLQNTDPLLSFLGQPRLPVVPIRDASCPTHALVTHLHLDHFDVETLRRVLGREGSVFCHKAVADDIGAAELRVHGLAISETHAIGGVRVTPVPAHDWRGDDQVSWVIETEGVRIFHGGDTIWHGYWWQIARKHGPFDRAFLPVNGVVAVYPGLEPSGVPATLTPEQAVIATRLLRARALCPMHYEMFNNPPIYVEQSNLSTRLKLAADQENVSLDIVAPGEQVFL